MPKYGISVDVEVEADDAATANTRVQEALSSFDNVDITDTYEIEDEPEVDNEEE
jgi:hypothetical protein